MRTLSLKKQLMVIGLIGLLLVPSWVLAYSAGGVVTLSQPNSVNFRANLFDSEIPYSWKNVTDDGYVFIDGPDGYFYYATLGPTGDYVPSPYKVGLDVPVSIPKNLERTGLALQLYQAALDSFNQLCLEQNKHYLNTREEIFLGVLLVEFLNVGPDSIEWRHHQNPEYTWSDFNQALESFGQYHTDLYGVTSPDGEPVFGSFKDYWWEVSRHQVFTETAILNPVINDSIQWLPYPNNVAFCSSQNYAQNTFVWNWAVPYADSLGLIPPNINYIAVVGAGIDWLWEDGLGWHIVSPVGGIALPSVYYSNPATGLEVEGGFTCNERWDWWGSWYQSPTLPNRYFNQLDPPHEYHYNNIGMYCHEAGHALFGWGHYPVNTHEWNLMISGTTAGPGYACSCPTHPLAPLLMQAGWLEPLWITTNQLGMEIGYDPQFSSLTSPNGTPIIYGIVGTQPTNPWQDYWLVENIRYEGFNRYAPGNPSEPENFPVANPADNLLIYHAPLLPPYYGYSHLENANNATGLGTQPEGCSFPGLTGRNHFLPTYEDTAIYDSRSVAVSPTWDGIYQEGVAFQNIISSPSTNSIVADVFVNYWNGTLDDAPGGVTTPYPESQVVWSGQDIIIDGEVILADYQTLVIGAGAIINGQNQARLVSDGLTIFESAQLAGDLTLAGNFQINQELYVAEGATVTFEPGSDVKFANSARLLVNGNLIAAGGPGEQVIHFRRLNELSAWEGIVIDNQSVMYPETSSLSYCNITGANIGLKTIRAHNLQVASCNLAGNTVGAYYLHLNAGGDPGFYNNNIYGNDYGLVIFGGAFEHDVAVLANNFYDNQQIGLFLHSGNSYPIGDNLITGSNVGVLCRNYTHSNFSWNDFSHPQGGYNTITGNHYAFKVYDGSTPYLGQIEFGFYGKNNFTNTDRYALWNTNPHILLMAEDNWWQGNPPDSGIFYLPEMVDYTPWSTTMNYRTNNLGGFGGDEAGAGNALWQSIAIAMGYLYASEPELAQLIYTQILEQYPNSPQAAQALDGLFWAEVQLDNLPKLMAIGGTLNLLLPPELSELAQYLQILAYLGEDEPTQALAIAQSLADHGRQPELRLLSQFYLGVIYKYCLSQSATGNECFARFVAAYPQDELALLAELELGWPPTNEVFGNGQTQVLSLLPDHFALEANHPNPFNASTNLRFNLPQTSRIRLEIYDIKGQRVTMLLDRVEPAGNHNFLWEPRSNLASGIYFCRLEAKSIQTAEQFMAVQRLLLLK